MAVNQVINLSRGRPPKLKANNLTVRVISDNLLNLKATFVGVLKKSFG
jgi:hypothetical protein